jgi:hypothetical protein
MGFEYRVIALRPEFTAAKWTNILNGVEPPEQGEEPLEGDWEIVATAQVPSRYPGGSQTGAQEVRVIMRGPKARPT